MELDKKCIGNDFKLFLYVYRLNSKVKVVITNGELPEGAVEEDLTNASNVILRLFNVRCGECAILETKIEGNKIQADIPISIQNIGIHYVVLNYEKPNIELKDGMQAFQTDCKVFEIVSTMEQATLGDVTIIGLVRAGIDGKSAYQIAQEHGYTGTEEEFGQLQYEATLAAINEESRILSEESRVLSENQRELNEGSREVAEDGRVLAESARVIGYNQMDDRIDGLQADITWLRDATVIFTINDNNELICNIPNGMTDSYELTENGNLILTY